MYIKRIEIETIKTFKKFTWELTDVEHPAGWHVLLGRNGSGKSSFIRCAAVCLSGPLESMRTGESFKEWISKGSSTGLVRLHILPDSPVDKWTMAGRRDNKEVNGFTFSVRIDESGIVQQVNHNAANAKGTVWGVKPGWFSASYGPFRRFTGGNAAKSPLFYTSPKLARHLSVFGEDVALTEIMSWLKDLKFKSLEESGSSSEKLLNRITDFVNQDELLPNGVKLNDINSEGVYFNDAGGATVGINSLSDGYRSVLSMMLELIRQMVTCYGTEDIFTEDNSVVKMPGVVFIDEVDVHLHPSWQRKIGIWLTKHFPKIQFIVTTHSALVCQAATAGSVWVLPNANGGIRGGRIKGAELDRLLYGNILEAFGSGAFGVDVGRSEQAYTMLQELAQLNVKSVHESLIAEEQKRLEHLRSVFVLNEGNDSEDFL